MHEHFCDRMHEHCPAKCQTLAACIPTYICTGSLTYIHMYWQRAYLAYVRFRSTLCIYRSMLSLCTAYVYTDIHKYWQRVYLHTYVRFWSTLDTSLLKTLYTHTVHCTHTLYTHSNIVCTMHTHCTLYTHCTHTHRNTVCTL
jgi:hypothetical protein